MVALNSLSLQEKNTGIDNKIHDGFIILCFRIRVLVLCMLTHCHTIISLSQYLQHRNYQHHHVYIWTYHMIMYHELIFFTSVLPHFTLAAKRLFMSHHFISVV